jgi:acyl transferase domain-containing protein/thioesterase domain-containing protein/acyl carrier protein/protein-L-isoaspartate O-methyltransferase
MDNSETSETNEINEESIAIIGMSGRFPGAKNIDEFWQNLKNGVESIAFFSDQELLASGIDPTLLKGANYVKAKGVLINDIAEFDAAFFGFSPKEAEITDPQQRLFLECAWEALENAGYNPQNYSGAIGVYGGVGVSSYLLQNLLANHNLRKTTGDYQLLINNDKDFLCTRVSYKLNLNGPSVTVQTACSTSLVATVMGCQNLLDYQCDMVLAGGTTLSLPNKAGYLYQEGMIMSPDGHCRAFDAKAQGTVGGSGVGIVVLKRLEDALRDGDYIHAVIKGAAINNDGALKIGYTAPSVEAQKQVIVEALDIAEISPETIGYVETHGTGTPLGDPIEIAALTQAFRISTDKKGYCAIGSVKTNVGHLDAAAGVTGLIKTVLSLKHHLIPPSLHFESPNPKLDLDNSPFYVNTELSDWKTDSYPRRAGVSSFGIGGTNAHVVLEEMPNQESRIKNQKSNRPWQLLLLSTKTGSALETATNQLIEHLNQHPDLNIADVAYTYQVGRCAFSYRRMLVCQSLEDAVNTLETRRDDKRVLSRLFEDNEVSSVVFMFSGQGAQYVNMGLELYQTESVFREQVDRCAEFLKPLMGLDLRNVLYPTIQIPPNPPLETPTARGDLKQTTITQPALFVIEYALAQLWISWGIQPKAMIGHSIGEYVAACLAGVFTLEEALTLVAARGQLMQSIPPGTMLAVPLSEDEIRPLLPENIDLSAINIPSQCVVSGTIEVVEQFANKMAKQGLECQRLQTSHAFHSEMMSPILTPFLEQVQTIELKAPKIPFLSNVTGFWITHDEATDPHYWVKHIRQTVRFAAGLQLLLQETQYILLEVGPGRTLGTFAKRHPSKMAQQSVFTSLRHPENEQSDSAFLLNTLGQLWMAGITVNWSEFYANEQRHRLPLPTYPFERQRYWVEPQKPVTQKNQLQQFWHLVVAAGKKQAQQGISELDNYLAKKACLDRLCVAYMNKALKDLGTFSSLSEKYFLDDLFEQFNIQPRYQQLLSRWMQVLVEQEQLQQEDKNFTNLLLLSNDAFKAVIEEAQEKWGDEPFWFKRVQHCGENLAAVLTGKLQALNLFSQDALKTSEENSLVQQSPLMQYYNTIALTTVQQVVKLLPNSAKLNILEIGGGTGYTTSVIIPILPPQQTQYTFTDISPLLVNLAEQKFSEYPFIQYQSLNIEQSPQEQGYEPHSFDMVIAINVLHVTRNMEETLTHVRSLLAPCGLLLIWEITQPQFDFDITDALLMNKLEDGERNQGNPFLSKEQWYQALQEHGFVEVAALPETDVIGHHIFVAKADASDEQIVPTAFAVDVQKEAIKTPPVPLRKKPNMTDWFYMPSWKQSMLPPPQREQSLEFCTLVFSNECGLCSQLIQQLKHQGKEVIRVKIGATFTKLNEHLYTLNPKQADDYDILLKELHQLNKIPQTIVHFWTVTSEYLESRLEYFDKAQELGFYSLFFLAQAFGKQNVTEEIQIAVVSNHLQTVIGSETLCPEKATVLGPVRVIPQEYHNLTCCSIDVVLPELGSQLEEKLSKQIMLELMTPLFDKIIAYRGNHRWVQTFEPFRLECPVKSIIPYKLRERGVYLITGGLGGIGLVFAEYLAKTVKAKLILLGRSSFPSRDEWSQWLVTHHAEDSISCKICKIQEMEQLGAEILVVSANVINQPQTQEVITQAHEQFEQIHGVIHAAGISPGGIIQLKTPEMVNNILAPKVLGTLVLNSVLKDFNLDFMILCSSLSSILGGIVDHCGANAFLDAFAHYNTSQCDRFTISINWDGWQEVGQAAKAAKQQHDETLNIFHKGIKEYLLPKEGVEVFSRILGSQLSQILVSTIDLPVRLEEQHHLPTILNDYEQSEQTRLPKPIHSRPQLRNAYVAPRTELEQKLVDIWQEFLGIEQVGIHDDFFDLGGDSLIAVQLMTKLRDTLQTNLSPHSLLNSPTIAVLAESIESTPLSKQPPVLLPSLLVEIKAGSHQKSPLFLLHPAGGYVYFYHDLANYLEPDQPVYGIQAQGLDGNIEPVTKIEQMATLYIEILRIHQPEGPYFLGGSSLGGMIAFEMAQQLNSCGQKIALLTMIDTPGPGQMPVIFESDVEILAYLLNVGANVSVSLDKLRKLTLDEQLRYFIKEQKKIERQMPPNLDITQVRHLTRLFKVNVQAMCEYQPQVYPGQIIFFCAKEKDAYNAKNPESAWFNLAADGLEIHEIPGNHITMNHSPHVEVIANLLKAHLDK